MLLVDGCSSRLEETRTHLLLLTVLDGLEQEVPQRCALEELAQHVVDAAAERRPRGLQLLQQAGVDLALSGVGGDQVPEVADLSLADAMDAAEALFDLVRVPRQIIVHHQVAALEELGSAVCRERG